MKARTGVFRERVCQGSTRPQSSRLCVSRLHAPSCATRRLPFDFPSQASAPLSDLNVLEGTGGPGGEGLGGRGQSWLGLESWLLPRERPKCTGHVLAS